MLLYVFISNEYDTSRGGKYELERELDNFSVTQSDAILTVCDGNDRNGTVERK